MMKSKWIKNLSKIFGVESVVLADPDGLIISSFAPEDDSAALLASLSVLTAQKIMRQFDDINEVKWQFIQYETEDAVILHKNMGIGVLVVIMALETDIKQIRSEMSLIYDNIQRAFANEIPGEAGGY